MSAYEALARWYDELTRDVDRAAFADFYEARFREAGREVRSVLDLACGTGALTLLLASRGYETIGVDASCEMLAAAAEKAADIDGERPLLLCQDMAELDLYGTVDAAVCCLDGLNYVPFDRLGAVFGRLSLFIAPGGTLIFDVLSPERLRGMDGAVLVDESEDVFCVWRGELNGDGSALSYGMDIFGRDGARWRRERERHVEYVHEPERLLELLRASGFEDARLRTDGPDSENGRIFITAIRSR